MNELPASLRALVNEARSDHDPGPEDARRVAAALSAAIPGGFQPFVHGVERAASGGSSAAATGVSSTAATGTFVGLAGAGKWFGLLLAVAATATAITLRTSSREHAAPETSTTSARAGKQDSPRSSAAAPAPAPNTVPSGALQPSAEPEPDLRGAPRRRPPASAPNAGVRRTPELPGPEAVVDAPVPTPLAPAAAAEAELPLIQRAARALRDHRPAVAQQLLEQHAAHFPQGMLAQERVGMLVIALCRQGNTAEAHPLRERFLAEAPESPLAGRVRSACTGSPPTTR